jgi:hypothetical protein
MKFVIVAMKKYIYQKRIFCIVMNVTVSYVENADCREDIEMN